MSNDTKRMCELKKCPFCGGTPYLERCSRAYVDGVSQRVAFVRCTKCFARTNKIPLLKYGKSSHSIDAEEDAVYYWNRRISDEV